MATPSPTRYKQTFSYPHLSEDQIARYERDGFLRLPGLLTQEGLEQMRSEVMSAWEQEKGPFDSEKTWLQNALLPNIHHRSPLVRQYYFQGPLVDIAEQLIGPNIKGATSQLTFKMRGNTAPFAWHQDNGYGELSPYNSLTTLTALEDTDEENGCLWVIPGSHKQGQIVCQHFGEDKKELKAIKLEVDEGPAIPFFMKAGDAICFHCWMLHKSEGNRSETRDRRILLLRYADADAVEVTNNQQPRLGRLLRGQTRFDEVKAFDVELG